MNTQPKESNVSEESETTAIALSPSELQALIPTSIDALQTTVHKDSAPAERRSISVPYVGFRGLKSFKHAEALDAAGIRCEKDGSGKFFLNHVTPIRVDPFRLHLMQYSRAYTIEDNDGNPTEAIFRNDDEAFADGFREAIVAVVAVVLSPGNYMPATLKVRGAQVNTLRDAINLMPSAEQGKLAARGGDWVASSKSAYPGGRFRVGIWSTLEKPDSGGEKFNKGHGTVMPTPAEEIPLFDAWVKEAWPAIQVVMAVNNARFEKVRRLANRQTQNA